MDLIRYGCILLSIVPCAGKILGQEDYLFPYAHHTSCTNDKDCSLNGVCVKKFSQDISGVGKGSCLCDTGWTGTACQTLDIVPTQQASGYREFNVAARGGGNYSSWGGGGYYDQNDKVFYMWATELADHCGMHTWTTNSMTVRASCPNATGLYVFEQQEFGIWSHESAVTRGPNGEYVAYFSYNADEGPQRPVCTKCTDGSTNPACKKSIPWLGAGENMKGKSFEMDGQYATSAKHSSLKIENTDPSFMSWSISARGNWTAPVRVQPGPVEMDSNMAGVILQNGTFVGMWRDHYPGGHWSTPHLVTSSDWTDPSQYFFNHADLIFGHESKNPGGIEDMFLYRDRKGNFHALFHVMFDCPTCTGHAFSANGLEWKWTGVAANSTATYTDGTSETFEHCERPHLLFAEDGVTPVALTNGVKIQGLSNDDQSFTLLRKLRSHN